MKWKIQKHKTIKGKWLYEKKKRNARKREERREEKNTIAKRYFFAFKRRTCLNRKNMTLNIVILCNIYHKHDAVVAPPYILTLSPTELNDVKANEWRKIWKHIGNTSVRIMHPIKMSNQTCYWYNIAAVNILLRQCIHPLSCPIHLNDNCWYIHFSHFSYVWKYVCQRKWKLYKMISVRQKKNQEIKA